MIRARIPQIPPTRFPSVALPAVMGLMLAACGSQADPSSTLPATPGSTPTAATPAPVTTPTPTAPADAETAAPTTSSEPSSGTSTQALVCTSPAAPTPSQTEGPYFTPGSPEKASLVEPGMAGTPLTLGGYVVTTDCTPLANAKVDVWQADAGGVYDNSGYTLRGHVFTDADGRFTIETVIPGQYPGRTEHIHVKVTPDGGETLTTQLYFPGSTGNEADNIFSPELLLDLAEAGDGYTGTITFVLER